MAPVGTRVRNGVAWLRGHFTDRAWRHHFLVRLFLFTLGAILCLGGFTLGFVPLIPGFPLGIAGVVLMCASSTRFRRLIQRAAGHLPPKLRHPLHALLDRFERRAAERKSPPRRTCASQPTEP